MSLATPMARLTIASNVDVANSISELRWNLYAAYPIHPAMRPRNRMNINLASHNVLILFLPFAAGVVFAVVAGGAG